MLNKKQEAVEGRFLFFAIGRRKDYTKRGEPVQSAYDNRWEMEQRETI